MHDWLAILLIAVASLGAGLWVLSRRRSASRSASPVGGNGRHEWPSDDRAMAKSRMVEAEQSRAVDAPSIHIEPLPEHVAVAILEFDGPPGEVTIVRGETVIGRHSGDDVRVPDVRVSRRHARIVARGDGGFEIHNLTAVRSEPNPMLVNGEPREHAEIADGDEITLGGVSFRFRQAARQACPQGAAKTHGGP